MMSCDPTPTDDALRTPLAWEDHGWDAGSLPRRPGTASASSPVSDDTAVRQLQVRYDREMAAREALEEKLLLHERVLDAQAGQLMSANARIAALERCLRSMHVRSIETPHGEVLGAVHTALDHGAAGLSLLADAAALAASLPRAAAQAAPHVFLSLAQLPYQTARVAWCAGLAPAHYAAALDALQSNAAVAWPRRQARALRTHPRVAAAAAAAEGVMSGSRRPAALFALLQLVVACLAHLALDAIREYGAPPAHGAAPASGPSPSSCVSPGNLGPFRGSAVDMSLSE